MLKGITKRQVMVLYVLAALLVVILGIRYAILPMIESNSDKSAELTQKMSQYDDLVFDSRQVQVYEELNKQLETDIESIEKSFLRDVKTSNIDAKISALIVTSGLQAVSLNVNEPIDVTEDSLSGNDEDTSNQQTSGSQSNVKSVKADVTATGSYDELVKLINLAGQQEAMYMSGMTFTMEVDEDGNDDEITVNFSIVSFVYAPQTEDDGE